VGFLEKMGLERPVVQAGMAGGVAGGDLAGAVSAAGGLGTVGMMTPRAFAAALAEAHRKAPGRPVAANLLVPFIKRAHVAACLEANAALVVLHGGFAPRFLARLRAGGVPVFYTVGTVQQARRALAEGADGLVVQGVEAGGHLVGVEPLVDALARILEVTDGKPVLAAGGVADAADVRRVLAAGAAAAVAGTRFLLTAESGAHRAYRERVLAADRTLVTLLFELWLAVAPQGDSQRGHRAVVSRRSTRAALDAPCQRAQRPARRRSPAGDVGQDALTPAPGAGAVHARPAARRYARAHRRRRGALCR
jgi:nitronate monooxygenase